VDARACEFGDGGGIVMGLRLPASESWPARVRQAKSFCASLAPDWISWQFVPYGFDPRGLCFGLGGRFKEIAGNCKSQIMFHEIWIGNAEEAPFKHKLVGKVQRSIIKDMLRRLSPRVVHTHTPLYRHLLSKLGCKVTILPLFGNVALAPLPDLGWLERKWPEGATKLDLTDRKSWWIFVMFGSIHPEWDAEDFWRQASAAAQRAGKKSLLISIGRAGAVGDQKLQELKKHESASWHVLNLGPQSEEDISQCLLAADFGVSAAPPENVFKSGTAAAMIEHGLHVIVTRPTARYPGCAPEILTSGMTHVITNFELVNIDKSKKASLLPVVANQFIEDLQRA
jgi:glycosyltransferase involved in cell wall biosynthesis